MRSLTPGPALRRSALGLLLLCTVMAGGAPAHAEPRWTGRITRIVPARRLVEMRLKDGRNVVVVVEGSAEVKKNGGSASFAQFHVGDHVVVQIAGALNDNPLDCDGLFDISTAGKAPKPEGSVNKSIEGSKVSTAGTVGLKVKFPHPDVYGKEKKEDEDDDDEHSGNDSKTPGMSGQWNPTTPWGSIPTGPGQTNQLPQYHQAEAPVATVAPNAGVRTLPEPEVVNPDGTVTRHYSHESSESSQTPSTAAPVYYTPTGVTGSTAPPAPASPVVPSPSSASVVNPYSLNSSPASIATGAMQTQGGEIVSLQGLVTQVDAAHRTFMVQSLVAGSQDQVQVTMPAQLGIISSSTQSVLTLDRIHPGDYIMLTGIRNGNSGPVEARRVYVKQ